MDYFLKEDKQKCEIIHNRDKNAFQNMLNIEEYIYNRKKTRHIYENSYIVPRYVITKFLLI
jgi:hypothetical protein